MRTLYIHGGGMDSPLGLVRIDYSYDLTGPWTIVPHASWRGTYETATFIAAKCSTVLLPSTEAVYQDSTDHMAYPASGPDVSQSRCVEIDFPGKYQGMTRLLRRQTVAGPIAWMGSLMQDAQDASGLMFRRNRYYDPSSGRFTQEDPIGLAGGVNAYGFANGDAVNYGDPYGLRAEDNCPPECTDEPGQGISLYAWWKMLSPRTQHTINVLIFGDACGRNGVRCGISPIIPGGGAASIAFTEVETAEISGILRAASRGKGNFGVGEATEAQANAAGQAWVGEGYTVASDGKTLVSRDQLRQYRPPSYKPRLGREQANLEARNVARGQWQSNAHIDIKR